MKIKVINNELPYYNKELVVIKINYDMIVAKTEEKKIKFRKKDVILIAENLNEEIIVKYEDLLKIKLDKTISNFFYTELIDKLKQVLFKDISNIEVLLDKYKIIKKGLWEKKMILVIDEVVPFEVIVIGKNYSRSFDIVIKEITLKDFVENCLLEIEMLNKEVEERNNIKEMYIKSLKNVIKKTIDTSDTKRIC